MPRILLTAFEPFDGSELNASLEAARAFREECGAEFDLAFAALPVCYGDDAAALEEALRRDSPEVLLLTGQTSRARVGVERIAVNVRTDTADWEQVRQGRCSQQLIDDGGPPAYFATLPVEAVTRALQDAAIPAELSNHAGIFLCNHILFQALHRRAASGLPPHVGFLHLPRLPEQLKDAAQPGPRPAGTPVTLEQLVAAVRATLSTTLAA